MTHLAATLRLMGAAVPRRRPKHVPSTELPKLHERNYAKLIREKVLVTMREEVERILLPELPSLVREAELAHDSLTADLDSWAMTLARIISGVRIQMARRVTDDELAELIRRQVVSGVMIANNQLNRNQLKVLLGIDILGADPQLRSLAEGFVAENVSLIKTIPEKYFTEIEQLVMRNVQAGRRASVIENLVHERYPFHAKHAELIARDQTSSLNAQITRTRHKALGITGYFWRDSEDDRVRPRHRQLGEMSRSGKIFLYAKPPIIDQRTGRRGNPGEDYQCRCTAEPAIPGIDDQQPQETPVRKARQAPISSEQAASYDEAKAQYWRDREERQTAYAASVGEENFSHADFGKLEKPFLMEFKAAHPETKAMEAAVRKAERGRRKRTR